jgi:hypothetical protein
MQQNRPEPKHRPANIHVFSGLPRNSCSHSSLVPIVINPVVLIVLVHCFPAGYCACEMTLAAQLSCHTLRKSIAHNRLIAGSERELQLARKNSQLRRHTAGIFSFRRVLSGLFVSFEPPKRKRNMQHTWGCRSRTAGHPLDKLSRATLKPPEEYPDDCDLLYLSKCMSMLTSLCRWMDSL